MIRSVCCTEDHATVKNRQDSVNAVRHLLVPEFQMSAVFLFPVLIQVEQEIQPAIKFEFRVAVEVGVNFKKAARLYLMKAAPGKVWIRNESFDARQGL